MIGERTPCPINRGGQPCPEDVSACHCSVFDKDEILECVIEQREDLRRLLRFMTEAAESCPYGASRYDMPQRGCASTWHLRIWLALGAKE